MRPVKQRGEKRTGLAGIVVDRLFAHQNQIGPFAKNECLQDAGHVPGIERLFTLHQDCPISTHRQTAAELFLIIRTADAHGEDLGITARLAKPDRFFECNRIERVDHKRQLVVVDSTAILPKRNPLIGIGNAFGGNQYFHRHSLAAFRNLF